MLKATSRTLFVHRKFLNTIGNYEIFPGEKFKKQALPRKIF